MSWSDVALALSRAIRLLEADEIDPAARIGRNVIPRVGPPVCCVQYAGPDGAMPAIPACMP